MRSPLAALSLLILPIACASAPPPDRARPAPPAASASAPTSPALVSSAAAPPQLKRRFVVEDHPLPDDLDADAGPAPCDFERAYRGRVGATPVTLLLRRAKDGGIEGFSHYDRVAPPLPITGTRSGPEGFTITELHGGAFRGSCAPGGALRGTFTLGKRTEPFTLQPRPASWPGLYKVAQRATFEPHHPLCKKVAKRSEVVMTSDPDGDFSVFCPPTDPAKRKAMFEEQPNLLCSSSDASYRVFGLPDAAAEKRANSTLEGAGLLIGKEIQTCSRPNIYSASEALISAPAGVLVVSHFRSTYEGGAHPMNSSGESTLLDLRTGRTVRLDEILDTSRLRDLVSACLPFYTRAAEAKEEFEVEGQPAPVACGQESTIDSAVLWGCKKDDVQQPVWSVVPEGVVIGEWGNPFVTEANDGKGPILPWAVLLREGLVRRGSPVARLWANIAPADRAAPVCASAFVNIATPASEGGWSTGIRSWREVPAKP